MSFVEYEEEYTETMDGGTSTRRRKVRLGFTKNLMPQCNIHPGDDWCVHIEQWIKDGDDAELFWDMMQPVDLNGYSVPVPVIPSHDQWVEVKFGPFSENVRSYPIELYLEQNDPNVQGHFLGFIGLGEGRLVMRNMVWQWFQGLLSRYETEGKGGTPTCISKKHNFKNQMKWEAAMKDDKSRIEQFFCVINKGACTACILDKEAEANMDDLVPF